MGLEMTMAEPTSARHEVDGAVPILLYHSVRTEPVQWLGRFNVAPQRFARHLDLIAASGAHPLTVSEYVARCTAGEALPERPVLITFDDGFADFHSNAFPQLAERQFVSTMYVTTGAIAGRAAFAPLQPMLSPSQIRELDSAGVEIGAHSHTHPQLDTISHRRVRDELRMSKEILENVLGHEVPSFAYPHGYSTRAVRSLVPEAGFMSACAVRNAFSCVDDDRFALARLTIESDTPDELLQLWLAREGAPIRQGAAYRARLWRAYRRALPAGRRTGAVTDLMFARR